MRFCSTAIIWWFCAEWPGGLTYYTTVGGSVEPGDADLEAALRREAMEEIGATIGPATEFLTLTEPGSTPVVQHFFLADLLDMDLNRRHGPELDDPDTGTHRARQVQNAVVAGEQEDGAGARSFLTCAVEVARLVGVEETGPVPESRRARLLAGAVRKPLLQRASLPEEFFAPLMAAAVYDPDPSFCRWFVEPALYAFGRRRVRGALVAYMRTGTDAERAGAERAWYYAHLPLYPDRSRAYGPDGKRDPALDASQDMVEAWLEASMRVFAEATDLRMCHRVLLGLPVSRQAYPPGLHDLFESTLATARAHSDEHIRGWAAAVDRFGA